MVIVRKATPLISFADRNSENLNFFLNVSLEKTKGAVDLFFSILYY